MGISFKAFAVCDCCNHDFVILEANNDVCKVLFPVNELAEERIYNKSSGAIALQEVFHAPLLWAAHGYCPACGKKFTREAERFEGIEDSLQEVTTHIQQIAAEHRQEFIDSALAEARRVLQNSAFPL